MTMSPGCSSQNSLRSRLPLRVAADEEVVDDAARVVALGQLCTFLKEEAYLANVKKNGDNEKK